MTYENAYGLQPVAAQGVDARAQFITRTYTHLFGAIVAFTVIEISLFKAGIPDRLFAEGMLQGRWTWLFLFGGFIIGGWMARGLAHRARTAPMQYVGLGAYVLLQAAIFMPILYMAATYRPAAIESAAYVTLALFAGLTAIAFISRKDFSFLRTILMWGGLCAFGAIIAGAIFGFSLGSGFIVLMIALAGGSILYDTSNVIHHYSERQYVGAALELFASVAFMFYYVLMLFLNRD